MRTESDSAVQSHDCFSVAVPERYLRLPNARANVDTVARGRLAGFGCKVTAARAGNRAWKSLVKNKRSRLGYQRLENREEKCQARNPHRRRS